MISERASLSSRDEGSGLLSVVVAILLGAAAVPALGRPEFVAAADFMTSGRPTRDGALAAVQLVVWTLVVVLVALQLFHALRRPRGAGREIKRRRTRSRASLLLGLLIFTGGAIHHQSPGASICCGDVTRAERLLH